MTRNKDTRDFSFDRVGDPKDKLNAFALHLSKTALVPGKQIRIDRINTFTGSPDRVFFETSALSIHENQGDGSDDSILIERALDHIRVLSPALGFTATRNAEFVPDPYVKRTSSGTSIVSLQQHHRGVPVYGMGRSVIFDPKGQLIDTTGTNVELPEKLSASPAVSVETALKSAAQYISSSQSEKGSWPDERRPGETFDVNDYNPEVLGRIGLPSQPSVLSSGPFAESIPAHLVFFYRGTDTRLGWHFVVSISAFTEQYEIIVEADSAVADPSNPEVLYAQKTSSDMTPTGCVWTHNPGVNKQRMWVDFPVPLSEYPLNLGDAKVDDFPRPWLDGDETSGNSTSAIFRGSKAPVRGRELHGRLVFDPGDANAEGNDQAVLNLFYFCNYMHDFFYLLGFDERHGNFQKINCTNSGTGNDAVLAEASSDEIDGVATFSIGADGVSPRMTMGVYRGKKTSLDSDVVFHEYTHGVSKRLVGGRLDARGLADGQSEGLGEGWSDYFALTVQNCLALRKDPSAIERLVIGDWVTSQPGGKRSAPYSDNFPATFGDIGTGRYGGAHGMGEIWCATLMKMNRDFGKVFGDKLRGHQLGWRIVVDGLKLTAADPSFLTARDAILQALGDLLASGYLDAAQFEAFSSAAWSAFARFGMGPDASCVGASTEGIREDFGLPASL